MGSVERMEGEVDSSGDATGGAVCDVDEGRAVGRTRSWKDVDSTLGRTAVKLE